MTTVARKDWGYILVVRLSCGHDAEVRPEWVSPEGRVGRVQCNQQFCRRITEDLTLGGWEAAHGR